jgi:outer membrane receptor protein involved in Fe transport
VYTREKIDQMGVTTVTDLLLRVPQSNAGALNGNNGGTGFASGGTGVSLRGLGLNATLILLNGRRVAPYGFSNGGTDSFVDLNALPLEAIEQVEILTSGASAIYGADAIAGVINIKTKKDYRGGELRFYYGNTVHEDFGTVKGSITFGTGNDKTDLLIVADYLHQNDMFNRDRTFSSEVDLRPYGGINNGSSFTYPGRFTVPRTAPGLAGTKFAGASGTVTLVPPLGTDGKAAPGAYHTFTDSDRFNFLQLSQAIPRSQREGVFGTFNHKIFDEKVELFGEFMFRHLEEHVELAPAPIDLAGSGSGIGIPVGTTVVKKGVVNVGNQVTIPSTNPFNPFGVNLSAGRIRLFETGNRITDANTDAFRFLGGLRGEISEKFSYETAVLFNRAQTIKNNIGVGVQQFQNALNDPNPLTAFNPFSGPSSPNNPATVAGLLVGSKQTGTTELLSWDAKGFGSLFDLPGGTVGYAVGLEYRTEKFIDDPDQIQKSGGIVGQTPILGNTGSRNLTAAYVESRIPITGKDWNILGFYRVDITAAGRIDSYSDFGDSEVPQIGIEWRPFSEDFLLRASYGESFRPASLQQLYNSPSDALTGSFKDPLRGTIEREIPISRGGNINLKPETATEWNAGFVLTPAAAKGLRLSAQWVQIARKNEIGSYADFFGNGALSARPGGYTRLPYEGDAAFLAANPGAKIPSIDPLTGLPAGQVFTLNDRFQNLGSTIEDALEDDGQDAGDDRETDVHHRGRFGRKDRHSGG